MINTLRRATKLAPLLSVAAILATAAPAFAQAPSQAQRDAIKSECRSDYMAHCSSVPPGGEASLQCLQKNMSSLSSSCQSAVRAVEAPAAATAKPAETAGAESRSSRGCNDRQARRKAAEPKAAAAAPGKTADQRAGFRDPQRLPLRLSKGLRGRADRRRAGAAMPGKEQGKTLGRLREGRRRRQRRWRGSRLRSGGSGCARRPAAAPAAAPTVIVLRPMRPREELFVLRSACGADVRTMCGGVAARRRPDRAVSGDQRRPAFAGLQGRAVAVRGAIIRALGGPSLIRGPPVTRRRERRG